RHGHRHSHSSSSTSYTTLSSELSCSTECVMCNNTGRLDCPGACQVADLCCTQGCLPAELSFNGELFGDLAVTGEAMLYFNRARIHGFVAAPNSDIVVAERTRFDELVTINFYGTIITSEFLNGITLTGCALLDPCCISVFLQGFFTTFITGPVTGTTTNECFDTTFCGNSILLIDLTTVSAVECQLSADCTTISDICIRLYGDPVTEEIPCSGSCFLGRCGAG